MSIPVSYRLALELETGLTMHLLLKRALAPLLVEDIVRRLPLETRLFVDRARGYAYLPLSLSRLHGAGRESAQLAPGQVAFMALGQLLVIGLRDTRLPYASVIIGEVEDPHEVLEQLGQLKYSVRAKLTLAEGGEA